MINFQMNMFLTWRDAHLERILPQDQLMLSTLSMLSGKDIDPSANTTSQRFWHLYVESLKKM